MDAHVTVRLLLPWGDAVLDRTVMRVSSHGFMAETRNVQAIQTAVVSLAHEQSCLGLLGLPYRRSSLTEGLTERLNL